MVWSLCAIHTHYKRCIGAGRLLRNYARACPESCDIATVHSVRGIQMLSVHVQLNYSGYQTLFKCYAQMAYWVSWLIYRKTVGKNSIIREL